MAKEVVKITKIEIPAGKATPAPPVGTALGPMGINLQEFCSAFNEATKDKMGDIVPAEITVYDDRTFSFVLKTPPTPFLIKKFAKIEKGSAKGANQVVATLTQDDLRKIAEIKFPDLNAYEIEKAMNTVAGTARNMGVAIKGVNDAELQEQGAEAAKEEAEMAKREAELAEMEQEAKEMAEAAKEVEVVGEEESEEKASETENNNEESSEN